MEKVREGHNQITQKPPELTHTFSKVCSPSRQSLEASLFRDVSCTQDKKGRVISEGRLTSARSAKQGGEMLAQLNRTKEEVKQEVIAEHCKGCPYYEEKGQLSECMEEMSSELRHGESDNTPVGTWVGYDECIKTCWKDTPEELARLERDRKKAAARYHDKHPDAKYQNKIKVTYLGVQTLLPGSKGLTLVNLPNGSTVVYNPNQHEIVEVK